MLGLGATELGIILLIVIVLFGASRMGQLGKGLGEGIRNFKESIRSTSEDEDKAEQENKS
ncbi:MAG: twin-arginine translocase TatA/TatE family subunit [Acidobacteriota bacterium]